MLLLLFINISISTINPFIIAPLIWFRVQIIDAIVSTDSSFWLIELSECLTSSRSWSLAFHISVMLTFVDLCSIPFTALFVCEIDPFSLDQVVQWYNWFNFSVRYSSSNVLLLALTKHSACSQLRQFSQFLIHLSFSNQ